MVLPFGDWRIPALHVLQREERFYEEERKLIENGGLRIEDGGWVERRRLQNGRNLHRVTPPVKGGTCLAEV
jgi:hypothetical protein